MKGCNLKIIVADPAKNITVFVLGYSGCPERRGILARKILADKNLEAEQAGFVFPPDRINSLWRLEMAGGEFCGNAARSLGLYIAKFQGLKGEGDLEISVSGAAEPVRVKVDTVNNLAAAEMPLPIAFDNIIYEGRSFPMLVFEGITHIIAPGCEASREIFSAFRILAEANFSILGKEAPAALGVMFYDPTSFFMRPVVYVRSVDSLFFENSCGSGSAALCAWLCRDQGDGIYKYQIHQPGGSIETEVTRQAGKVTGLTIGGEVKLGEVVDYSFDDSPRADNK